MILSPRTFLAGLLLGFACCCLAGRLVRCRNCYHDFERFHFFLAPETHFYPTASQVHALGKKLLDPNKVAVIIGGTSIMHGVGQSSADLWTKKLQQLLGDDFRVINFAMRGAQVQEFGSVAAEILSRDFPKLLFVSDAQTGPVSPAPDGDKYRYFFWDARGKGMLIDYPPRERRLAESLKKRAREQAADLCCLSRLDGVCGFNDLWTTVGYQALFTVWNRWTAANFTCPRRRFSDPERSREQTPAQPAENNRRLCMLREWAKAGLHRDENDGWVPDTAAWNEYELALRDCFPDDCRRRGLLLYMWYAPHVRAALTDEERACLDLTARHQVERIRQAGFQAMEMGRDFTDEDFCDHRHLAPSGGNKMAVLIAPKIRQMAQELSYWTQNCEGKTADLLK